MRLRLRAGARLKVPPEIARQAWLDARRQLAGRAGIAGALAAWERGQEPPRLRKRDLVAFLLEPLPPRGPRGRHGGNERRVLAWALKVRALSAALQHGRARSRAARR